uniref:Uncharacterized protein n=1 Tax=Populus trichocarpa TaxID=3694 RepID=A0A2K1ZLB3_POPTR
MLHYYKATIVLSCLVASDNRLFLQTTIILSCLIAGNIRLLHHGSTVWDGYNRLLHHGSTVRSYLITSDFWHPHSGNLSSMVNKYLLMLVYMMLMYLS